MTRSAIHVSGDRRVDGRGPVLTLCVFLGSFVLRSRVFLEKKTLGGNWRCFCNFFLHNITDSSSYYQMFCGKDVQTK